MSPTSAPATNDRCKIIKTPGSHSERVAQACDRCRAKKTKCDGKKPCTNCSLVGFECKISDKLSRRAFPRGYTETLEERVRQLEIENKKLLNLLDLRDEQMELYNKLEKSIPSQPNPVSNPTTDSDNKLSTSNISLLNSQSNFCGHGDDCNHCCENYPHLVHEKPVSITGSIDNLSINNLSLNNDNSLLSLSFQNFEKFNSNLSFEQNKAPGAKAAISIAKNLNNQLNINSKNLASLVAMSIPRSTEETLFIPSLLAKICEFYGYNSKASVLTANCLASLKQNSNYYIKHNNSPNSKSGTSLNNKSNNNDDNSNKTYNNSNTHLKFNQFNHLNFNNLSRFDSVFFLLSLKFPSRINLDELITVFFKNWNNFLPIIDKFFFLKNYLVFCKSMENDFNDGLMYGKELFAIQLILIITLSLLTKKNLLDSSEINLLNYYDIVIHEILNMNSITKNCSIQTLQILSLSLLYCLNIGDITTCYEIRGGIITMTQQLRLHRCPSAVLSNNGSQISNFLQGERRILFWCIYTLDVFSSLLLGVPRLMKDFEIECALPFASDDDTNSNENILIINNDKLSLIGKVSNLSLSIMRFSKILGNIIDSIFKRNELNSSAQNLVLLHENFLDNWRRDLNASLKFDIDVNGQLDKNLDTLTTSQFLLIFLYYQTKLLIYLPVMSQETNQSKSCPSFIIIQNNSIQILKIMNYLFEKNIYLSLPLNLSRQISRLCIIAAKGCLEYTKNGSLFQDLKNLLKNSVNYLKFENKLDFPGCISSNSITLLDLSIKNILNVNMKASSNGIVESTSPNRSQNSKSIKKENGDNDFEMIDNMKDEVLSAELKNLNENLIQEFAADGSLGLAPLLDFNVFDLYNNDINLNSLSIPNIPSITNIRGLNDELNELNSFKDLDDSLRSLNSLNSLENQAPNISGLKARCNSNTNSINSDTNSNPSNISTPQSNNNPTPGTVNSGYVQNINEQRYMNDRKNSLFNWQNKE